MQRVAIERVDTERVWVRSRESEKFLENGLWGLRDIKGKVILEPKYDQIELCKEFIYVHSGTSHSFYYPYGKVSTSVDNKYDYRFYENGKIGLKDENGSIRFPAIYDCVKDWPRYDVVYVRNEDGFHYYNSDNEEILTDYAPIEGSDCNDEPFFDDEKQNTGVLITRRFVEGRQNNNCVRMGSDRWVEFSRIAYKDLRSIVGKCEVIPMPDDAFLGIESKSTYIYSAFIARSKGETPVEDCISQLAMLGAYQSTWRFLTKVWIHPESSITMETLKKIWLVFSVNSDFYSHEDIRSRFEVEDWLRIGIGYDDTLEKDELKILQVQYFTDRWPEQIEMEWVKALRNEKVEKLKEIHKRLTERIEEVRKEGGDEYADTMHSEILEGCHIASNATTDFSIEEEIEKYDYLHGLGFHCIDTLWFLCGRMLSESFNENEPKPMEESDLMFCKKKIEWLLKNDTSKNFVRMKMMPLDMLTMLKNVYAEHEWPLECLVILTDIEAMMRRCGCRYAHEHDIDKVFWREFKPGLYDETPFETKPYIGKVIIDDVIREEDLNNLTM